MVRSVVKALPVLLVLLVLCSRTADSQSALTTPSVLASTAAQTSQGVVPTATSASYQPLISSFASRVATAVGLTTINAASTTARQPRSSTAESQSCSLDSECSAARLYCCTDSRQCCSYGDLCYNTSSVDYYCKQGYYCCLSSKCCPNRSVAATTGPTVATAVGLTTINAASTTARQPLVPRSNTAESQSCFFDSDCRRGLYCCTGSRQCCSYGDLCYNTSSIDYYCKQGYHCCGDGGYLSSKCCPGRSAAATTGPTMTGVLIASFLACALAKGHKSSLL